MIILIIISVKNIYENNQKNINKNEEKRKNIEKEDINEINLNQNDKLKTLDDYITSK